MSETLIGWQSVYTISMFLGTFVSYLTPIILIRRQQQTSSGTAVVAITGRRTYRVLSICNCVSAGIFLGICFLNLIPYVEEEFNRIFILAKIETTFPVGMVTVILGLILVLTLETLVMKFRSSSDPPVLHLDEEDSTVGLLVM